jgi:hypothetical protein
MKALNMLAIPEAMAQGQEPISVFVLPASNSLGLQG